MKLHLKKALLNMWILLLSCSTAVWALDANEEADKAYQHAMQAMQTESWSDAELHFERVLMFNPEHAEARIQLAMLLARRGQAESATSLIQTLIDDPRTPTEYRQRLNLLVQQMHKSPTEVLTVTDASKPTATPRVIQARIALGYSTNPFAQADISNLTISLPQGNLELGINPDIKPAGVLLSSLYYKAPNDCGFELFDQRKESLVNKTSQKMSLFCNTIWSQEKFQTFASTTQTSDGNQRTEVGQIWLRDTWRVTGQIYQEPELHRQGYTLRWDQLISGPDWQLLLFLEGEHNNNQTLPGYAKAGIYAEKKLQNNISLLAQTTLQHDFTGYSPLLNNGARRELATAELGLQKQWGSFGGWDVSAAVFRSQRWSNLPLFEYKDLTLQINIRRFF